MENKHPCLNLLWLRGAVPSLSLMWKYAPQPNGCNFRHNVQTNKGLVATAAAAPADLITQSFWTSSAAQRDVNDGINDCGFPHWSSTSPVAFRQVSLSWITGRDELLHMAADFTFHICSVTVSSSKCLVFLALIKIPCDTSSETAEMYLTHWIQTTSVLFKG